MDMLQKFFELDVPVVVLGVFIIIAAIRYVLDAVTWVCNKFGIEFKWMRERDSDHKLLEMTVKELKDLEEKHENDVQKSINHDKKLEEKLSDMSDSMNQQMTQINDNIAEFKNDINQRMLQGEKRENSRVQAELKDRIGQSYRYYNNAKQIKKIELEALEDLIATYEEYGGKNSFVHSVVQKEMYTWKQTD